MNKKEQKTIEVLAGRIIELEDTPYVRHIERIINLLDERNRAASRFWRGPIEVERDDIAFEVEKALKAYELSLYKIARRIEELEESSAAEDLQSALVEIKSMAQAR